MSGWHAVATAQQLEREGRVVTRVGGREIGVVRDDRSGELFALRNRCPHYGAPLCLGTVRPRATGAPGRYEVSTTTVIRCPWHGWEFDTRTGECAEDPRMRVATYPVRVLDGTIEVRA